MINSNKWSWILDKTLNHTTTRAPLTKTNIIPNTNRNRNLFLLLVYHKTVYNSRTKVLEQWFIQINYLQWLLQTLRIHKVLILKLFLNEVKSIKDQMLSMWLNLFNHINPLNTNKWKIVNTIKQIKMWKINLRLQLEATVLIRIAKKFKSKM